jgi:UDP:flavonoid glycosyltransferase YjiC (YdhE family)
MAGILAVTWDGGGNVPPMLGVAAELLARGHEVRVLGHATQRDAVERTGAAFVPHRHGRAWAPAVPASGPRRARDLISLFTEHGPGRDVTAEIEGPAPPDAVLVDCLRLGPLRAAVRSPVPTVALVHTFRRYVAHDWARGPVGLVATLRGLRPGPLWNACDRLLVATDPALDPGAADAPANARYTGAVLAAPRSVARTDPPTVLVSLSTIFYPTQAAVLQRVLDALADLEVRVVAATGFVDPAGLRAGANTTLQRHLPHDEVMPSASLVVGHGGHATTLRALAHGLPVLTIPLDAHLDHRMVGEAVRAAGAGDVLDTGATPDAIRDAVTRLLVDPAVAAAAEAVGTRVRGVDGAARAADEVEAVVARAVAER